MLQLIILTLRFTKIHAETYENGTYLLNTIYPTFYPHNMNYFDFDFFYKIVRVKEFNLSDECKVLGITKIVFLVLG